MFVFFFYYKFAQLSSHKLIKFLCYFIFENTRKSVIFQLKTKSCQLFTFQRNNEQLIVASIERWWMHRIGSDHQWVFEPEKLNQKIVDTNIYHYHHQHPNNSMLDSHLVRHLTDVYEFTPDDACKVILLVILRNRKRTRYDIKPYDYVTFESMWRKTYLRAHNRQVPKSQGLRRRPATSWRKEKGGLRGYEMTRRSFIQARG